MPSYVLIVCFNEKPKKEIFQNFSFFLHSPHSFFNFIGIKLYLRVKVSFAVIDGWYTTIYRLRDESCLLLLVEWCLCMCCHHRNCCCCCCCCCFIFLFIHWLTYLLFRFRFLSSFLVITDTFLTILIIIVGGHYYPCCCQILNVSFKQMNYQWNR